jgi:hypothetical protein
MIQRRVLIVGESWAAGGRMFPELPDTLARRLNGAVSVCTIGFSGKNTGRIVREFDPHIAVAALGGPPTNVVILTGVNDQVQRRGPRFYVTGVKRLMALFPTACVQVVSAPLINTYPPVRTLSRLRNLALGTLHPQRNAAYRWALTKAVPHDQIIDFTEFSRGFAAEPGRYEPDGIHPTRPVFHEYGAFIGSRIRV